MIATRLRFTLALVLFAAWLGWLAVAVAEKGKHPVLSRSQLLAATHLVVADLTIGADGLPEALAVVETLRGDPLPAGALEVANLPSALVPGAASFAPGRYLVPLAEDGRGARVADSAASPGSAPEVAARPRVYAWDDATRAQLAGLGLGQ